VQVIHSSTHLRHDPAVETEHGFLVAHHELPARAERVIAALTADPTFTINAPRAWGTAPIEAVHEPGLVRFLSTAWDEFQRAVRPQRDVFPDVFMHDALRVGMEPLAADRTNILGGLAYWYALTPAHALVFRGMLRRIAGAALRPAAQRAVAPGS